MNTVGIVLAGGRSTRFGEDKSLYLLDGKPMYRHVYDLLADSEACNHILVSSNSALKDKFEDIDVIVDDSDFIDYGPLGGLYAVAKQYPDSRFVLVSCDTPYVPSAWIKRLVARADEKPGYSIITKEGERMHPTIAVFNDSALAPKLAAHLADGGRSIRSFFQNINVDYLELEEASFDVSNFININRKTDLQ